MIWALSAQPARPGLSCPAGWLAARSARGCAAPAAQHLPPQHCLRSSKRLPPKQITTLKIQKGKVCDFFLNLIENRSVLLWSFLLHLRFMSQSFVLINQSSLQTLFLYNIHFITFYKIKLISIVTWLLLVFLPHCTTSELEHCPVPSCVEKQEALSAGELSSSVSPSVSQRRL